MVKYYTIYVLYPVGLNDTIGIQDNKKQIWKRGGVGMKKNYLKVLICSAAMIGVFLASTVSTYGCYFWFLHQRECPKALIRED